MAISALRLPDYWLVKDIELNDYSAAHL